MAAKKNNPRQKKAPEVLQKKTPRPPSPVARARGRDAPPAVEGPRFVGGPRNEFGTRIARRVTCARCGTADHVPFVPKDPTKALCRTCAAEVLSTYELGVRVRTQTKKTTCNLCGTPFDLPVTVEDDGDPLCPMCLRGFTAWQGSLEVPFTERKELVVEERFSGALVRKRKRPDA